MKDPTTDPLAEHDRLIGEYARLLIKFKEHKLSQTEFENISKPLKEQIANAELQAYGMARKDGELAKKLRSRTYDEPMTQLVINYLVQANDKSLDPEFGPDRLPRYPLENDKGERIFAERSILQRLADIGTVTESIYERILFCPECGRPSDVYLRFKCTQCDSMDITINRMMEHLHCGTIHQETAFLVGRNIVCPSCKKAIQNQQDYRLIGIVCSCNSCHAHFEDPSQSFFCRKCEKGFTLLTGKVTDVFSYRMKPEALKEALQYIGVNLLAKVLIDAGMHVRVPGVLTSGSKEVVFSLVAEKNGQTIAVDLVRSPQEVELQDVLDMYAKVIEANPTCAILGAVPRASTRARDIAAQHKISVIEGTALNELASKIAAVITK